MTDFVFQGLGISGFSLNRLEPDLNKKDGDFDTATPRAMAEMIKRLVFDKDVLSEENRLKLQDLLKRNINVLQISILCKFVEQSIAEYRS